MRIPVFRRTVVGFPFFRFWVMIRRLSAHPPVYTERNRIGFRPLASIGDWQLAVSWRPKLDPCCWNPAYYANNFATMWKVREFQAKLDQFDRETCARNSGGGA